MKIKLINMYESLLGMPDIQNMNVLGVLAIFTIISILFAIIEK